MTGTVKGKVASTGTVTGQKGATGEIHGATKRKAN
jgi:hypothetical protein